VGEAVVPFCERGRAGFPSNNVTWAEAYLCTKWHLDPSNRLATIRLRYRLTGQQSCSIWRMTTEKPVWILMQQQITGWQWHQLDHIEIICTSL